jgi:hypothetical protein
MTKNKLIDACINKFGGKIEDLIHRLATYQGCSASAAPSSSNTHNSPPEGEMSILSDALLLQIIKSTFLPKISAKREEYLRWVTILHYHMQSRFEAFKERTYLF